MDPGKLDEEPEELTLPLAAEAALAERAGAVVTNLSTSGLVDRVAARHGGSVVRTPVGQAFVSEAILEHRAVLGGEGNGGVAVPRVQATHDSAATIGLLLQHLAREGRPLSAIVAGLPSVVVRKLALAVAPSLLFSVLQDFRDAVGEVAGADVDQTDGVKIVWPDGWVHVRASNTQSLVRVIAESDTAARAQELSDWARERLRV